MFQILKVATNEPSTLHLTICTWIALENYNNNDQQVNRQFFLFTSKLESQPLTFKNFSVYICVQFQQVWNGYLHV